MQKFIDIYQDEGNLKLSDNFNLDEFRDKSDDPTNHFILLDPDLLDVLQEYREWLNQPVSITSGFRSQKHNVSVGGVARSYHTMGMAADIFSPKLTTLDLFESIHEFLEKVDQAEEAQPGLIGGVGFYMERNFVHLDTRPHQSHKDVVIWEG